MPVCRSASFAAVVGKRDEDGGADCAEDDGQRGADGNVYPVHDKHFDADKAEDEGEAVVEEDEAVGHVGEQKVHGTQAEDGEDVGGENDEGVGGDGEDGGNAVDGKDDVAQFHHHQHKQQRGGHAAAVFAGEEFFAVEGLADADVFLQPLQNFVLRQVFRIVVALLNHFDAGVEQKGAEEIQYPFEAADEDGADENHEGAQDDGAEHAVEQDAVLVLRRHFEVAENH